jgi:hypothetical protein
VFPQAIIHDGAVTLLPADERVLRGKWITPASQLANAIKRPRRHRTRLRTKSSNGRGAINMGVVQSVTRLIRWADLHSPVSSGCLEPYCNCVELRWECQLRVASGRSAIIQRLCGFVTALLGVVTLGPSDQYRSLLSRQPPARDDGQCSFIPAPPAGTLYPQRWGWPFRWSFRVEDPIELGRMQHHPHDAVHEQLDHMRVVHGLEQASQGGPRQQVRWAS